jgi:hypothetical protein
MASLDETQQEIDFLAERIEQLRALQYSQRHLHFVTVHLQDHIEKLQNRVRELAREKKAS